MQGEIEFPARYPDEHGAMARLLRDPLQMHIRLIPDQDFDKVISEKDLNIIKQFLKEFNPYTDIIEILVRDDNGNEKFKLPFIPRSISQRSIL